MTLTEGIFCLDHGSRLELGAMKGLNPEVYLWLLLAVVNWAAILQFAQHGVQVALIRAGSSLNRKLVVSVSNRVVCAPDSGVQ